MGGPAYLQIREVGKEGSEKWGTKGHVQALSFGTGSMLSSVGRNAFSSSPTLESLVVPSNVSSLGIRAFEGCSKLRTITFGAGSQLAVLARGSDASGVFTGASGLTSLEVPPLVTSIPDGSSSTYCSSTHRCQRRYTEVSSFSGCAALTSITFAGGSKLHTIGASALSPHSWPRSQILASRNKY